MMTREEVEQDYELNTGKVIVETFKNRDYNYTPGVLVAGHGPFTWGTDPANAVHNSVVLEELARMALYSLSINPFMRELPDYILNKHFYRKHGKDAYYGQRSKISFHGLIAGRYFN